MAEFKFPTEEVELPSKGLIYPKSNPLSSGKVELKYMTAKEEDILTNQNYIEKGIVLDKLLESLTMKKVDLKDLCIGDKNAIMVAARILGYGQDYEFTYNWSTSHGDSDVDNNTECYVSTGYLPEGVYTYSVVVFKYQQFINHPLPTLNHCYYYYSQTLHPHPLS